MQKLPFSVLTIDTLVDHVTGRITEGSSVTGPAFALILGAGFSYPLFPAAADMVKQDMAWWKFARHRKLAFTDTPPEDVGEELLTHARTMWATVQRDTEGKIDFTLDPTTRLPADGGDNITQAYQAIMSGQASKGLNTPGLRRSYFRDLCRRVDKRINLAHLYLGSLLHGQAQETWKKELGRSTFTQTILTTNFDPLLQRALQLHNVLYFMSDQPEGGIATPDDDEQAVHLVYTHGSVHRRHLANNPSEILSLSQTNATTLSGYLARQGVIVIGYSGWNDTTFQALQSCTNFEGNLYWCGRESAEAAAAGSLREDVKKLLARNTDNRFYVELGPGGADDLLYRLHKALINALPTALVDPAGLMINEIDSITWPRMNNAAWFDGLKEIAQSQLTLLRDFKNRNSNKLTEPSDPAPQNGGTQPLEDGLSAASLRVRASIALHNGDFEEAVQYLTKILEMPDVEAEQRATALVNRGVAKYQMTPSDLAAAIRDYSSALAVPDAPPERRAMALLNRGVAKSKLVPPDSDGEIADYSAVVAMPGASTEQRAQALFYRGLTKRHLTPPDVEGAIADYNAVLAMPNATADQRAKALVNRGVAKGKMTPRNTEEEIADYSAVVAMSDAPAEQRARALLNRGVAKGKSTPPDLEREIADYSAVVTMPDAPVEQRAQALVYRGITRRQMKPPDWEGAIADYNAVLAMPDASAEQRAKALINRGLLKRDLTPPDIQGAIADYTDALAIPGAPAEQRAKALFHRGTAKSELSPPATEEAIADYNAVLAMPDAPVEQRAKALIKRGITKRQITPPDQEGEIADYNAVLAMPGAPATEVAISAFNLACVAGLQGNAQSAVEWLHQWRKLHRNPTAQRLDTDTDFDAVRNDPLFIEFRNSLPGGMPAAPD
ncbi:SIR2 family protein [Tahibacter sp. UC22_41]|uniref:TPR end-of-group domain-containing protein n=1 Tax=Tahibacter sp. UC22_41 TaxID=3350178 RepID=UPI0036DBA345